jgi:hypothetical protein
MAISALIAEHSLLCYPTRRTHRQQVRRLNQSRQRFIAKPGKLILWDERNGNSM